MSSEEFVDIVDDSDCVVGQALRSDVRRKNLRHRSVYILVFNSSGQLFAHRRTLTKDVFPGYWDVAVGGVLTAGEEFKILSTIPMGEAPVRASIAVAQGELFVRTAKNLYCIRGG